MEVENDKVTLEVPVTVQIVAWLLILEALWAGLGMIVRLLGSCFFLDFRILYLFIGYGLLELRNGWRKCALVFIAFGWVIFAVMIGLFANTEGPLEYKILGILAGYLPKWTIWVMTAQATAWLLFQTWVLIRPRTRQLFLTPKGENTSIIFRNPLLALLAAFLISGIVVWETGFWCRWARSGWYQPPPVWRFAKGPPVSFHGYLPTRTWDKAIHWDSPEPVNRRIPFKASREIIVTASRGGTELARFECVYDFTGTSDEVVSFHLEDRSVQVHPDYTFRSVVALWGWSPEIWLSLATTEDDPTQNLVLFRNEQWTCPGSGMQSMLTDSCPTLRIKAANRFQGPGLLDYLYARGVAETPAPVGMFPGSTRPVHWTLWIRSREEPDSYEVYDIPEGERKNAPGEKKDRREGDGNSPTLPDYRVPATEPFVEVKSPTPSRRVDDETGGKDPQGEQSPVEEPLTQSETARP